MRILVVSKQYLFQRSPQTVTSRSVPARPEVCTSHFRDSLRFPKSIGVELRTPVVSTQYLLQRSHQTVTSRVSTGAPKRLYQSRPRTVAFSKKHRSRVAHSRRLRAIPVGGRARTRSKLLRLPFDRFSVMKLPFDIGIRAIWSRAAHSRRLCAIFVHREQDPFESIRFIHSNLFDSSIRIYLIQPFKSI